MSQSDPNPAPSRREPRRAEPLQPDAPTRGQDREPARDPGAGSADGPRSGEADTTVERQKQQSDKALENVREGY